MDICSALHRLVGPEHVLNAVPVLPCRLLSKGGVLMAERDYPKLSVHSLSARKPAALAATGEDQFADFVRLGSRTSTTFAISPMSRDSL